MIPRSGAKASPIFKLVKCRSGTGFLSLDLSAFDIGCRLSRDVCDPSEVAYKECGFISAL